MYTGLLEWRFLIWAVAPGAIGVHAQDYQYRTNNNGTITITSYAGSESNPAIPSTINGLAVTEIGDWAFYNNSSLTSITLPPGIVSIGKSAFMYCSSVTNVTIPDGVTFIDRDAFSRCGSLASVAIPRSVTSIVASPFQFCTSLTNITVELENSAYSSLEGVLFDKLQTTLVEYPEGRGGGYSIPDGVETIGAISFDFCGKLTRVTIPASVTSIGMFAFYQCDKLTGAYFEGAPPVGEPDSFTLSDEVTVFHLPTAGGWTGMYSGRPTTIWQPEWSVASAGSDQVQFNVRWAGEFVVEVESADDLTDPKWAAVESIALSEGSGQFAVATYDPAKYYRLKWEPAVQE